MTKEEIYDEKFAPLVAELIRLSKEHDIPMLATWELNDVRPVAEDDDGMLCTTAVYSADACDNIKQAYRAIRNSPAVVALTIGTKV